jgi:hypothetical protein
MEKSGLTPSPPEIRCSKNVVFETTTRVYHVRPPKKF